ncbi:MAG: Gfo/Idh/MocA family oxidoreductase [Rhodobacteraceae bacterium]|nr:Gfo/Idh/MocA family oxidoreductase [Paracoccaceae bacterium]
MKTAEGITLCLIGCGAMGSIHARHLAQDTRVGHLILCEADMGRAEALAKELGPRGPTSEIIPIDQAFDGRSTDGFLIASPAAQHAGHLRAAAATNPYIFCEKPVATDPEDIVSLAAELGHAADRVQVGFNRRFDHHLSTFKSRLVAGAVGQIEQLHLISRDHAPPMPEHLPFSAGLIAETMIHDFDTVRWLLEDEISSVTCHGSALINPSYAEHGHIDTATTVLIGASGQQVVIQNSWRAPQGYDQRIEALGAAGVLRVENPCNSTVT